jgi:hypothetical protein
MNRLTIRRFDVVRTANIVAALYVVTVAIFMLLFFVPIMLLAGIAGVSTDGGEVIPMLGAGIAGTLFVAVIAVVFYGVIGWVMAAIGCAVYNWVAGRIGGLRMEVEVEWPSGGGPGYPVQPYAAPGYPQPAPAGWPVPGSPGGPVAPGAPGGPAAPPPPGWGQPGS